MRFLSFFLPITTFFFFFVGCSTDSAINSFNGSFERVGLEGITINGLHRFEGYLYAATDSGVHRRPQVNGDNSWSALGLQEQEVIDVVFLPDHKLLAAIRISDFGRRIPSLYLSSDKGQDWQAYMNNYGGETGEYTWVGALGVSHQPSDTIFARVSGLTVVYSANGGKSWEVVNGQWNQWGGAAVLVKPDPYYKNRVWAGGMNAIFQPYLIKSTDGGETWQRITILENVETTVYDVATHPSEPNRVLAGLGIGIRKSSDGGESWQTVFQQAGVLTLVQSPQDGRIVYAAGGTPEGTLSFFASGDFGDTWQQVEMPDSPSGIRVNDMVSVLEGGKVVLYLGTNKGVYLYTIEDVIE